MILRPYQLAAADAAVSQPRALLALPTGTGKTVIAAEIARRLGGAMFVAHRQELLDQARRTFAAMGARGEMWSVQSMHATRRELTRRPEVLIIDEAHHACASTYRALIEWAQPRHLVGITATPYRLDEAEDGKWRLGDVFGPQPAYVYPLMSAVRDGWLTPIRQWGIETGCSLAGARISHGDIASTGLLGMDCPERNALVADSYVRLCGGRRAIAFTTEVLHAQNLATTLEAAGVRAAAVWGAMTTDDRADTLRRYDAGELDVLCNCEILTEGFDSPATSAILMARPTVSRGLYVQMAGRGLRIAEGKTDCLIIDYLDVGQPHSLNIQTAMTLAGTPPGMRIEDQNAKGRNVVEAAQEAQDAYLATVEDMRARLEIMPLEWTAKDRTPRWSADVLSLAGYTPEAKWHHRPASAKQVKTIKSWGFTPARELRRGEASALIDQLLTLEAEHPEPATAKQESWLRWKGAWKHGMTKREAKAVMVAIMKGRSSGRPATPATGGWGEWK